MFRSQNLSVQHIRKNALFYRPPHQVIVEIWNTTVEKKITSKRSLIYHSWITLSTTLLGFAIGTLLGILLAVLIVHSRVLDKSLMPWIIASQTIPILAIAPMIIVVLNAGWNFWTFT